MPRKKRIPEVVERPDDLEESDPLEGLPRVEQSGDLQGLPEIEGASSESVRELVEDGQFFEADVVSGVENAPPADAGPIRIRRRTEDDVPPEYTERAQDEPKE